MKSLSTTSPVPNLAAALIALGSNDKKRGKALGLSDRGVQDLRAGHLNRVLQALMRRPFLLNALARDARRKRPRGQPVELIEFTAALQSLGANDKERANAIGLSQRGIQDIRAGQLNTMLRALMRKPVLLDHLAEDAREADIRAKVEAYRKTETAVAPVTTTVDETIEDDALVLAA